MTSDKTIAPSSVMGDAYATSPLGGQGPVRAPKQARSRQTLETILNETRQLLEVRNFDDIPIADIVAAASTTVGSFYARFPDKASLLIALQAQAHDEVATRLEVVLSPDRWATVSLRETISGMIPLLMEIPDRHLAVFKAAMLSSVASKALARNVTEIIGKKIDLMATLLLSKRSEIRHPNPDRAVRSGAAIVESVLQHRRVRLFVDTVDYPLGEETLCPDLCEMLLALLASETSRTT